LPWNTDYSKDPLRLCLANCTLVDLFKLFFTPNACVRSGFGYQFGLMPYGESWRSRRRLFKKYFNMSSTAIYRIPEAKYLHRFLHQLLEHPTDFVNLLHQSVVFCQLSFLKLNAPYQL